MNDPREERLSSEDQAPPRRQRVRGASYARDSRSVLEDQDLDERSEGNDAADDREFSDDVRLEMFRDSLEQSVLPDLPKMPGYHVCWLTTSNPRDTISRRQQIGYQLITKEMLPAGWQEASLNSAAYPGVVQVNEMLAARIPVTLYNKFMREVHEIRPLQEEEKLRASVDGLKARAQRLGAQVQEGDGTEAIVQRAPPMPAFTE